MGALRRFIQAGHAAGAPAIGTGIGGVPEILIDGQTANLVDENSPAQIARATKNDPRFP